MAGLRVVLSPPALKLRRINEASTKGGAFLLEAVELHTDDSEVGDGV